MIKTKKATGEKNKRKDEVDKGCIVRKDAKVEDDPPRRSCPATNLEMKIHVQRPDKK
jgi:hypothetical protein